MKPSSDGVSSSLSLLTLGSMEFGKLVSKLSGEGIEVISSDRDYSMRFPNVSFDALRRLRFPSQDFANLLRRR